ncbi:MAG: hypothetical protein GF331_12065 [Chitinivibrionales bacterium]|nr:hypothetical protein [Chitinivibrionales bacterium]
MSTRVACCVYMVLCGVGLTRCISNGDPLEKGRVSRSPDEHVMLYLPDCPSGAEGCAGKAVPLGLDPRMPLRDLLDSIGARLSRTYFARYGDRPTDIRFAVHAIEDIGTPGRWLEVGVIDIVDTAGAAMRTFFQGSAGASATENVLLANFLQPQLDPPLLDGTVFLYNGEPMREMAHLDLSGIQTPNDLDPRVEVLMRRQAGDRP